MSADGVRSLVQGMTQVHQQGISSISKILSITTKDGKTGPIVDYPDWRIESWHDEDGGCDDRGVRPQNGVMLLKQEMDGLTCKD